MIKRRLARNLIVAITALLLLGAVLLIGAPNRVSAAETTIEIASNGHFGLDYHTINNAFGGSVDGDGNPLSWADGQPPVLNHLSDAELQSGLTIGIYGWVCFSNEIIDYGYKFDNGDIIWQNDAGTIPGTEEAVTTEAAVTNRAVSLGWSTGQRFHIEASINRLGTAEGNHTLTYYILLETGATDTYVAINSINLNNCKLPEGSGDAVTTEEVTTACAHASTYTDTTSTSDGTHTITIYCNTCHVVVGTPVTNGCSYGYSTYSRDYHTMTCSVCNYSTVEPCSYTYTPTAADYHTKRCEWCLAEHQESHIWNVTSTCQSCQRNKVVGTLPAPNLDMDFTVSTENAASDYKISTLSGTSLSKQEGYISLSSSSGSPSVVIGGTDKHDDLTSAYQGSELDYILIKYRVSAEGTATLTASLTSDGVNTTATRTVSGIPLTNLYATTNSYTTTVTDNDVWNTVIVDASSAWGDGSGYGGAYLYNLTLTTTGSIDVAYMKFFATSADATTYRGSENVEKEVTVKGKETTTYDAANVIQPSLGNYEYYSGGVATVSGPYEGSEVTYVQPTPAYQTGDGENRSFDGWMGILGPGSERDGVSLCNSFDSWKDHANGGSHPYLDLGGNNYWTSIGFYGWIKPDNGDNGKPITAVGYQIDGGEIQWTNGTEETWYWLDREYVKSTVINTDGNITAHDYTGRNTRRYAIWIDVPEFSTGVTHYLWLYAKDEDGHVYSLNQTINDGNAIMIKRGSDTLATVPKNNPYQYYKIAGDNTEYTSNPATDYCYTRGSYVYRTGSGTAVNWDGANYYTYSYPDVSATMYCFTTPTAHARACGHTGLSSYLTVNSKTCANAASAYVGSERLYCTSCRAEPLPTNYRIVDMAHDRTNERVISQPTCTAAGTLEYTCPSCSQVFTDELPALGHSYRNDVVLPGCETMGYTKHVCSRCDNAYIDLQRDPLGHQLVGTSNGDGTWTVTCERGCGYSAITTYDPATHTSCDATLATRTVAATCVRSGSIETYCRVCDRVTASTFLPALGHNLVDKDAKAATCCESGHNAYQVCTRCSYHTYQEIPALGHSNAVNDTDGDGWSVVAATETMSGSMSGRRYKICDSCGVIYAEEIIPKATASKKENE